MRPIAASVRPSRPICSVISSANQLTARDGPSSCPLFAYSFISPFLADRPIDEAITRQVPQQLDISIQNTQSYFSLTPVVRFNEFSSCLRSWHTTLARTKKSRIRVSKKKEGKIKRVDRDLTSFFLESGGAGGGNWVSCSPPFSSRLSYLSQVFSSSSLSSPPAACCAAAAAAVAATRYWRRSAKKSSPVKNEIIRPRRRRRRRKKELQTHAPSYLGRWEIQ